MIAIFLFYNESYGIQNKISFSKDLKHCNMITYDGRDWVFTTLNKLGVYNRAVRVSKPETLLRRIKKLVPGISAIVVTYINERRVKSWFPLMINSCNEVLRVSSGIDCGITFNVAHFYKKLIMLDGLTNYNIDYSWRRSDGLTR